MNAPAKHLLVVDDEVISAMALERFLSRKGFRVTLAGDGLAALDAQRRDPADLVLTDMRMPKLSGDALIARLRADSPHLPVILMTGYMPSDMDVTDGADTVVMSKPLDPVDVLRTVQRLLLLG